MSDMLGIFYLNMHAMTGFICLIAATTLLCLKKGDDRHKMFGQIFSVFGLILVATAFIVLIDLAINKEFLDFSRDSSANIFTIKSTSYALHHVTYFIDEYFALIVLNILTLYLIVTGLLILRLNRQDGYAKVVIWYMSFITVLFLISAVGILYYVWSHNVVLSTQAGNLSFILAPLAFLMPYCAYPFIDTYSLMIKPNASDRKIQIMSHFSRMLLAFGGVISAFLFRFTNNINIVCWTPILLVIILIVFYRLKLKKII